MDTTVSFYHHGIEILVKDSNQRLAKQPVSVTPGRTGNTEAKATDGLEGFLASVERKAYYICLYALHDEQAALDVVQESMLKLVEKYGSRPSKEWPALFFTILNHRITDLYRWRKLREAGGRLVSLFRPMGTHQSDPNSLETGVGMELATDGQQPDHYVYGLQLRRRIDSALTRLSNRQRQVFLLREWQGFNVRETAQILGCSQGSVKQHHFRALQTLRAELAEVRDNE